MKQLKNIIFFSCFLFLTGCLSTQHTLHQATKQGFQLKTYSIDSSFTLTTYEKHQADANSIHVYIEGDGHSWQSRYKLSSNPTPKNPLALKLARLDPHPHVVYLARPCQYTPFEKDLMCQPKYWSSHRFSPEVIEAMDDVLDQIKRQAPSKPFILIGYSGGGGIAALLSAKRSDVVGLVTLAGDLDHQRLSEYHQTQPNSHSLNPVTVAPLLKKVPQLHVSGEKDTLVPPWVAKDFARAVNHASTVKTKILPNVTHQKGWEKYWAKEGLAFLGMTNKSDLT